MCLRQICWKWGCRSSSIKPKSLLQRYQPRASTTLHAHNTTSSYIYWLVTAYTRCCDNFCYGGLKMLGLSYWGLGCWLHVLLQCNATLNVVLLYLWYIWVTVWITTVYSSQGGIHCISKFSHAAPLTRAEACQQQLASLWRLVVFHHAA